MMKTFKIKNAVLIVLAICAAVFFATVFCVKTISHDEREDYEQLLLLLCETGERNLDHYFDSVQQSVGAVASFAENDINNYDDDGFREHVKRVERYFGEISYKTSGILTYYYRIDPKFSENVRGFWYTNLEDMGFSEHEVTDITQYDTEDTSKLVWFTVTKHAGEPVWLPPYITENLGVRVISYNVPITWNGEFVGVVGMEIDYSMMANQVESIRIGSDGYAFLNDAQGNLFYHRDIDTSKSEGENARVAPEGLLGKTTFVEYTYQGVPKLGAWLTLSNGMRLTVAMPLSETEGESMHNTASIVLTSAVVAFIVSVIAVFLFILLCRPITRKIEH